MTKSSVHVILLSIWYAESCIGPRNISMGWYKKDVAPCVTHRSYVFLALTHRYVNVSIQHTYLGTRQCITHTGNDSAALGNDLNCVMAFTCHHLMLANAKLLANLWCRWKCATQVKLQSKIQPQSHKVLVPSTILENCRYHSVTCQFTTPLPKNIVMSYHVMTSKILNYLMI